MHIFPIYTEKIKIILKYIVESLRQNSHQFIPALARRQSGDDVSYMFRQMDEAYCKRDLKIHTDNTECVGDGCGNVNSDKTLLKEVN